MNLPKPRGHQKPAYVFLLGALCSRLPASPLEQGTLFCQPKSAIPWVSRSAFNLSLLHPEPARGLRLVAAISKSAIWLQVLIWPAGSLPATPSAFPQTLRLPFKPCFLPKTIYWRTAISCTGHINKPWKPFSVSGFSRHSGKFFPALDNHMNSGMIESCGQAKNSCMQAKGEKHPPPWRPAAAAGRWCPERREALGHKDLSVFWGFWSRWWLHQSLQTCHHFLLLKQMIKGNLPIHILHPQWLVCCYSERWLPLLPCPQGRGESALLFTAGRKFLFPWEVERRCWRGGYWGAGDSPPAMSWFQSFSIGWRS